MFLRDGRDPSGHERNDGRVRNVWICRHCFLEKRARNDASEHLIFTGTSGQKILTVRHPRFPHNRPHQSPRTTRATARPREKVVLGPLEDLNRSHWQPVISRILFPIEIGYRTALSKTTLSGTRRRQSKATAQFTME